VKLAIVLIMRGIKMVQNLQFDKGVAQEPRWRVASTTDYKSRVTQEVNRELETGYSN
jgi:hypothetical protein